MAVKSTSGPSPDALFYKPADAFFTQTAGLALTYDDISLATLYSDVLPRDAQLETRLADGLQLRIPIVSADMDTVTEAEMAIALARCGGMGLIHCNMSERDQLSEVSRVKNNVHGSATRSKLLPTRASASSSNTSRTRSTRSAPSRSWTRAGSCSDCCQARSSASGTRRKKSRT